MTKFCGKAAKPTAAPYLKFNDELIASVIYHYINYTIETSIIKEFIENISALDMFPHTQVLR